jgi:hypothetical protein
MVVALPVPSAAALPAEGVVAARGPAIVPAAFALLLQFTVADHYVFTVFSLLSPRGPAAHRKNATIQTDHGRSNRNEDS